MVNCMRRPRNEIIAMTAEEYSDLKNVTTEAENIQQWRENLLQGKVVYGTQPGRVDSENWV